MMNKGRSLLPWSQEIWDRIDQVVYHECKRTTISSKFLPLYGPVSSGQLTIPTDSIEVNQAGRLIVREAATNELIELVVEFTLTEQQVAREEELGTAMTLATRAANLLSQGFDVINFQGRTAVEEGPLQHPLFRRGADGTPPKVIVKSGIPGIGLLDAPDANNKPDAQVVIVKERELDPTEIPPRWGENTFGAVAEAYSILQNGIDLAQAHYGPYALVLHFMPYADTYAPLATTLIIPADRIKPLVTEMPSDKDIYMQSEDMHMYGRDMHYMYSREYYPRYYGTGTLPNLRGLFLSLGGNTMDLVVGVDAKTEFVTEDTQGNYCFRVYKRFVLRLKDKSAVIRLQFEDSSQNGDYPDKDNREEANRS